MTKIAQTSVYFTKHDQEIMESLQQRHGISRSAVIRLALERLYASDAERKSRLMEIAEEIKQLA